MGLFSLEKIWGGLIVGSCFGKGRKDEKSTSFPEDPTNPKKQSREREWGQKSEPPQRGN